MAARQFPERRRLIAWMSRFEDKAKPIIAAKDSSPSFNIFNTKKENVKKVLNAYAITSAFVFIRIV